jgi:hypothetical protein
MGLTKRPLSVHNPRGVILLRLCVRQLSPPMHVTLVVSQQFVDSMQTGELGRHKRRDSDVTTWAHHPRSPRREVMWEHRREHSRQDQSPMRVAPGWAPRVQAWVRRPGSRSQGSAGADAPLTMRRRLPQWEPSSLAAVRPVDSRMSNTWAVLS